jgi:hypothetical protein
MSYAQWQDLLVHSLETDPPQEVVPEIAGMSPGGAAAFLGVSRQRVHQLMKAGKLDAITVWDNPRRRVGLPQAIYISAKSLRAFQLARGGKQQQLPFGKKAATLGP